MRRLDVLLIGLAILLAGGFGYLLLQALGLDAEKAGIWTQAALFLGVMGWLSTYLFRVSRGTMTYHEQIKSYEDQVLQKRLDALTPEELAQLQAEIHQEKASQSS